jgi:hypothetical protein
MSPRTMDTSKLTRFSIFSVILLLLEVLLTKRYLGSGTGAGNGTGAATKVHSKRGLFGRRSEASTASDTAAV